MRRTLQMGIAILALMGASLAGQTIHGRDGITLPPPPAVDAAPVTDNYSAPRLWTTIAGLRTPKAMRPAHLSMPKMSTRAAT